MSVLTVEDVYERHIKPLPVAERLRLIAMTAEGIAKSEDGKEGRQLRRITELRGLGAEAWRGIDAQTHIDELRSE
jgi:hypothetical protein